MNSDRYRRMREIFHAACESPAEARAALLQRECGDDAGLRSDVLALLNVDDRESGFLDRSTDSALAVGGAEWERPGQQIGQYTLLELVGEGGFGRVHLAQQRAPIARLVAIKILKLGMDTRQVIARFEQERQALSLMDHPGIAKVLDAGTTESGRPYVVMEYVPGQRLTDHCDANQLDTRERLTLFTQVCEAVQHAHQKGIIHRDLKSSNILVAVSPVAAVLEQTPASESSNQNDSSRQHPQVKVIDFGVAKAVGGKLTNLTLHTEQRQLIGTPASMSPEQAASDGRDIDTRTDVYSLGALLYELLAGVPPLEEQPLREAGLDDLRRMIREVDPLPPSRRLHELCGRHPGGSAASASSAVGLAVDANGSGASERPAEHSVCGVEEIARLRKTDPASLRRQLRQELDWIVMKCLEKDRERRYSSAAELGEDVRRHLRGDAVRAAPPSAAYRFRKLVRRNRGVFAATATVFAALLAGATVATLGLLEARRAQHRTAQECDNANRFAEFMEQTLAGVGPAVARGRDTAILRELMDSAAARIEAGELTPLPAAELRLRSVIGDTFREIAEYPAADRMLRPALELARRLHPAPDRERAAALQKLAALVLDEGKYAEAEQLSREVLTVRMAIAGESPAAIATCHADLASVLLLRGVRTEAETHARTAVEMVERDSGANAMEKAACVNVLATVLEQDGALDQAEPLYREVVRIRRDERRADDPALASSLNNLAKLVASRDPAEAESLYQEALDRLRRTLGPDHPEIATVTNNLAQLLRQVGRFDESQAAFEKALAIQKKSLGEKHPHYGHSLANLATLLRANGKLANAEKLWRELVDVRSRTDAAPHEQVAALNSLGLVQRDQGNPTEAATNFAKAVELSEQAGDKRAELRALALHHLAEVQRKLGQLEQAEAAAREAVELYRAGPVRDASEHAHALQVMATVLIHLGRNAEGEPFLEQRVAVARAALPAGNPGIASALMTLGSLRLRLDKPVEALPLLEEALEIRDAAFPEGHPQRWERIDTQSELGEAARLQGVRLANDGPEAARRHFDRAEQLLTDAKSAFEKLTQAPPERSRVVAERLAKLAASRATLSDPTPPR